MTLDEMQPNPKIFDVATKIWNWIRSLGVEDIQPVVTFSGYYESLEVCDTILWDSEGCGAEELTFEACKTELQQFVSGLLPIARKT